MLFNLVFSNNLRYRITRHILFWVVWVSFYAFIEAYRMFEYRHIPLWPNYLISWGSLLIQMPIDIAFCYSVIYFLLPRFFLQRKYAMFIVLWIFFAFIAGYVEDIYFFTVVSNYRVMMGLDPMKQTASYFLGALEIVGSLNTEGGFAIAIKFAKMFAVKQKEAQLLSAEKEKLSANIESKTEEELKPTFLLNILQRLYALAQEQKINTGESLKKVNDLFVYTSYDAKKTLLPLDKELCSLEDYVELEQIAANGGITVSAAVNGATAQKMIAPNILIPIAEYCFSNSGNGSTNGKKLDIDIRISGNDLTAVFTGTKSAHSSTLLSDKNSNIGQIEKRLKLLYAGNYSLKKTIEPTTLRVELTMKLTSQAGI